MTRRASLPGADELFRATGAPPAAPAAPATRDAGASVAAGPPPPAASRDDAPGSDVRAAEPAAPPGERERHTVPRRRARPAERRPTGRERHDEKITVYCSPDELMDLERARLALRGDHGIAVDRGRIVREAIALALEALEAEGDDSPLVRRLTGR